MPKRKKPSENDAASFIERNIEDYAVTSISNTGDYFDLYVLSTGKGFDYGTSEKPALSDGHLSEIDQKYTLFGIAPAGDAFEDRIKNGYKGEHLFTKEVIKAKKRKEPLGIEIKRRIDFYFAYYIVTYNGIASHLEKMYNEHVEGNRYKDIRRSACFHETLYFNKHPYKLYIDIEYEPRLVPDEIRQILTDEEMSYDHVYREIQEKIRLLLECLKTYWYSFKGMNDKDCQIKYLVFQANRPPKIDKPGKWKLSYHIIWFVSGCRFVDRQTVSLFLKNATQYNPNTGLLDDKLRNRFFVNKIHLLDYAVYTSRNFRTPYSCKVQCGEDGVLCPPLLPVLDFYTDNNTISCFPGSVIPKKNELGMFRKDIFLFGLVHHIDVNERVQFFISISASKRDSHEARQFSIMDFEKNIWLRFSNDEAMIETSHKLYSLYGRPDLIDAAEPISVKDQIVYIGDKLGDAFARMCKKKTITNMYGDVSVAIKPYRAFTHVEDGQRSHEILIFWCLSNTGDQYPCLARPHMCYHPHKSNNNYLVLNIHERKWYIGCHDPDCIEKYNTRKQCQHKKAKSDEFMLDSEKETAELNDLVGFLSYTYHYYDSVMRRKSIQQQQIPPDIITIVNATTIAPLVQESKKSTLDIDACIDDLMGDLM